MMKNKKLNLNDLKVSSFVTTESMANQETVKGGIDGSCVPNCGLGSPLCAYTQHSCFQIYCDQREMY